MAQRPASTCSGDTPWPDDSWAVFMAERRRGREQARLHTVAQQRKAERHARGLLRKPNGQGRRPIDPAVRVVGRPLNPSSKRQQQLAARAARKAERELERQRHRRERKAQIAEKKRQEQRIAQIRVQNTQQFEERRRRTSELCSFFMAEHSMSNDFANYMICEVFKQLFGYPYHGCPTLPEEYIAADSAQRRTDLLLSTLDAMASDTRAMEIARQLKRNALPAALTVRVKDAPMVVEYLKPERERSWNRKAPRAPTAFERAAAKRARQACDEQWQTDVRIDMEHEPPQPHASRPAAARIPASDDGGEAENEPAGSHESGSRSEEESERESETEWSDDANTTTDRRFSWGQD